MFATLFCFHLYFLDISWEQISLTRPTEIAWFVHPDKSVWDEYIEQGNLGLFWVSWSGGCIIPCLQGMIVAWKKGETPTAVPIPEVSLQFQNVFLTAKTTGRSCRFFCFFFFWGGGPEESTADLEKWCWCSFPRYSGFRTHGAFGYLKRFWRIRLWLWLLLLLLLLLLWGLSQRLCFLVNGGGLGWSTIPGTLRWKSWKYLGTPPFSENTRGDGRFWALRIAFWDLMFANLPKRCLQEMHYSNANCFWEGW